jgi:hypothetical protein
MDWDVMDWLEDLDVRAESTRCVSGLLKEKERDNRKGK